MTDVRSRDVDRGWAWVVLTAAALSLALQEAFLVSLGIFQVEFLETFSSSQGFVAMICAFAACGQVMTGPVAGILVDLLTHRVTIMIGGTLKSVALLVASFCREPSTLLLFFGVLSGLGAGLCYTPSITVVSTYFHRYRTIANGISLAAPGLGYLVGPYVLRWLIDSCGWRYTLALHAGMMAQICILGALMYPLNPGRLTASPCGPCGSQSPASEGHTAGTFSTPAEDDSPHQSDKNRYETKQNVTSDSMSKLEVKPAATMELLNLLGSRSDLVIKAGSRTDLEVKAGSRTNLEVRLDSRTDLGSKASSRTELPSRPVSRISDFGSVLLNQSVECVRRHEMEATPLRQRTSRLLCRRFIWIICINQLLMMFGQATTVILFPAFAQSAGLAATDVPFLYSVFGVTLSLIRVVGGFVFSAIPRHLMQAYFVLQVVQGLAYAFLPLYGVSFPTLLAGIVMIGLTYGPTYLLLTPVILCSVELPDLSLAYGLVMLSCGVAAVVAPSVGGSACFSGALLLLVLLLGRDRDTSAVKDDGESKLLSTNQKNGNCLERGKELVSTNEIPCDTLAQNDEYEPASG